MIRLEQQQPDLHRGCGGRLVTVDRRPDGSMWARCDQCRRVGEIAERVDEPVWPDLTLRGGWWHPQGLRRRIP